LEPGHRARGRGNRDDMVAASLPAGGSGPLTEEGIRRLLDLFYRRVRRDPVLGPVFTRVIGTTDAAWAAHLARLADFWSSLMLRSGRYRGDPFSVHLRLPNLQPPMFDRWLALFGESCGEVFEPDVAGAFLDRAERVARSLRMGLFERLPTVRAGSNQPEGVRP
ncbi:MAG: group III truncated hemoglobin, partial [Acetobacteraceae bacterium]